MDSCFISLCFSDSDKKGAGMCARICMAVCIFLVLAAVVAATVYLVLEFGKDNFFVHYPTMLLSLHEAVGGDLGSTVNH